MLRIVFMGTPHFAVPILKKLIEKQHEVVAVVTQPDRPQGRKQSCLVPTAVKAAALSAGITRVLQPERLGTDEFYEEMRDLAPDLVVTAAYGKKLPKRILDIPALGCINIHASLLPRYRGAAPIQFSIINGDAVTGITSMYMDENMDTGDMLIKKVVEITENMTCQQLHEELEQAGAEVMGETLDKLLAGTLVRIPQNHSEATYVPMMRKEMGEIDWKRSAREIHNLVRGTNPWPGAYTTFRCCRMKIWETRIPGCEEIADLNGITHQPGQILKVIGDSLIVATGNGLIKITEIQPQSGKRMSICQCGHNMDEGEFFG